MDHYISMFIDNELTLDEKILFIEGIHRNEAAKDECLTFLDLEKKLRKHLVTEAPENLEHPRSSVVRKKMYVLSAVAACLLCALSFVIGFSYKVPDKTAGLNISRVTSDYQHRFILYREDVHNIEITGSFTDWRKIPLVKKGETNYWEVILPLPQGEHRYSFIIDGKVSLPDPTVSEKESDDFGTLNSLINV